MNRDKLIRFFEGTTSHSQEVEIRQWLDSSPENITIFNRERALYDASLFSGSTAKQKGRRVPSWIISAAAAVIATLVTVGSINYITNKSNDTESYNTVIVPPGQRVNIILSDNSNVWINANSKFVYPSQFKGDNRVVHLDGEAFFEVKSDKEHPFIVKTDKYDVRATGTKFNVESYSKSNSFETSLFEGRVDCINDSLVNMTLKPQEKVTIENGKLQVSTISSEDKYLWRKGLIAFNNAKLEEILHSLEKYFNVKIVIEMKKLPQHTYSGKLRQSDGVEYSLRVLQRSISFNYERDEVTGIITIKQPPMK